MQSFFDIAVPAGIATGVALLLIRLFGAKWIESFFSKRMELYRLEIGTLYNRVSKIHEKEFEVLPLAWEKLSETRNEFIALANPIQIFPNSLDLMSIDDFEEFLTHSELDEQQKKRLRGSQERSKNFRSEVYWMRLGKAKEKLHDLRIFLMRNKIFLSRDLYKLFSRIESTLISADVSLEFPESNETPWHRRSSELYKNLTEELQKTVDELEEAIQKRLRFEVSDK